MLIVLDPSITPEQRAEVLERVQAAGCQAQSAASAYGELLIVEGDLDGLRRQPLKLLAGVRQIVALSSTYTLSSLEHQREPTIVEVGAVRIGGGSLTIIGGPCAVESPDQLLETARAVKLAGADLLRGGAYKPRTSPYSFRGLGIDGLRMLRDASLATGLPTVSEVMDPRHVEACVTNVDMVQVGTRNMNNFDLLIEIGQSGHPVLLKRGRSATITDWLLAAEYVLAQGNPNVVLCERGVRGFDPATRNLLDLTAVAVLRERTHLPVVVDPSHGTGHARYVPPMARAAVAAGADGVLVEVHRQPDQALSDAEQALEPAAFRDLCEDLRLLASVQKRDVPSSDG